MTFNCGVLKGTVAVHVGNAGDEPDARLRIGRRRATFFAVALLALFSGCITEPARLPAPPAPPPTSAPTPPPPPPPVVARRIPNFPDPVPKPSTSMDIKLASLGFGASAAGKNLGDIDDRLSAFLNKSGYVERRYFAFRGGYVVMTRIESIQNNGRPTPDRWNIENPNEFDFTLAGYLRAVFQGPAGRSRFLAFVVSHEPLLQKSEPVSLYTLDGVFNGGVLNVMPEELRKLPTTAGTRCHVLVYEFKKTPKTKKVEQSSSLNVVRHLAGASLSPPLY